MLDILLGCASISSSAAGFRGLPVPLALCKLGTQHGPDGGHADG